MTARVLVVDDERSVVHGLARLLVRTASELEVVTATSGAEALEILEQRELSVIVTDLRMPGMNGLELLEIVARRKPTVARVMLSGTAEAAATTRALSLAHRFLCKPCDRSRLASTCRELHHHRSVNATIGAVVALGIDAASLDRAHGAVDRDRAALCDAVAAHPALAGALLHAVGSEFLGSPTSADTLEAALDVVGESGFSHILASGALQVVDDIAAAPLVALASAARARFARAASPTQRLAALLADVDRFGSTEIERWTGLREASDAATLLGMWGAPSALVDHVRLAATQPALAG